MEYFVTYNGSIIFSGNQEDLDRFFNKLLFDLNCPVNYETLDEYLCVENQYYMEHVEGIPVKDYICGNTGISEELYNELQEWLNSKNYKEFTNHEVNTKPF